MAFFRFFLPVLCALALVCAAQTSAQANGFARFLKDFQKEARAKGVSNKTYRRAFANVKSPDQAVIRQALHQPEFRQELWQYFDSRVNEAAVKEGVKQRAKWRKVLKRLEAKYGIDRHILLAIWSMESSYGRLLQNPAATKSVMRSLATLAYKDKRRSRYARTQLIAALQMLQAKEVRLEDLTGSWAGAMGQTQFIPTSYRAYAKDGDDDGKKDIWRSVPDALASAANLLRENGWRSGQSWGYEVRVPEKVYAKAGETRALEEWENMGVRRVKGRAFMKKDRKAVLRFPAGTRGPAFLMMKNFFVLKRYNNADKYALAVGHLADRIAGFGDFSRSIPRPHKKLSRKEKMALQTQLARHGFYEDEIDGKVGPATRSAILRAQERLKLKVDGYESRELTEKLRRKTPK